MPCTPPPVPLPDAASMDAQRWVIEYALLPTEYDRWHFSYDVCRGALVITRSGVPVSCRELWPAGLLRFCASPPPEPEPPPPGPPPPPPGEPCTPPPTPAPGHVEEDVAHYLARLQGLTDDQRMLELDRVCQGRIVLTRDGEPIDCREHWPSVVWDWCGTGIEPEPFAITEREVVQARANMTTEYSALTNAQLDVRLLGRTAYSAARHLHRWRTGDDLPPRPPTH